MLQDRPPPAAPPHLQAPCNLLIRLGAGHGRGGEGSHLGVVCSPGCRPSRGGASVFRSAGMQTAQRTDTEAERHGRLPQLALDLRPSTPPLSCTQHHVLTLHRPPHRPPRHSLPGAVAMLGVDSAALEPAAAPPAPRASMLLYRGPGPGGGSASAPPCCCCWDCCCWDCWGWCWGPCCCCCGRGGSGSGGKPRLFTVRISFCRSQGGDIKVWMGRGDSMENGAGSGAHRGCMLAWRVLGR